MDVFLSGYKEKTKQSAVPLPPTVENFVRSSAEEPPIFDDSRPPPPPGFGVNDVVKPQLKVDKPIAQELPVPFDANLQRSPLVVEEPAEKRSGQPEEPFPPPPLHQSKAAAYESKRSESVGRSADDVGDTIFIGKTHHE